MIVIQSVRRGLARCVGIAVTATLIVSAAPSAQAASLIGPAAAPVSKQVQGAGNGALITQVQHRGGGGGHGGGGGGFHGGGGGGGGFHGGGFHGGGAPAFHGGGFAARPAFVGGGGFHRGPAFHGGGFRYGGGAVIARHHFRPRYYGYADPYYYGPSYYHHPRRFCRVVFTHFGPRKICRYRPWRHHFYRHHYRRHHHWRVYW